MLRMVLIGMCLLCGAIPASATTFAPVEQKCPVGGKSFTSMEMMSTTTWGSLPDGMPLGVGPNPPPLPQCPDNGLVIYKDFDKGTVAKLPAIVLAESYQSLRRVRQMPCVNSAGSKTPKPCVRRS